LGEVVGERVVDALELGQDGVSAKLGTFRVSYE